MILTIALIKGGVGKSSTAAALLQAAAAAGQKALAVDMDPSGNLTAYLGGKKNGPGIWQALQGEPLRECITTTPQGVDLLASSPALAKMVLGNGSGFKLKACLEPVKDEYGLIIIDTPPAIGEQVTNSLLASDGVIIPLETDGASVDGLKYIAALVARIRPHNAALVIKGIIATRYTGRSKINKQIRDDIAKAAVKAGLPFLGEVRQGVAIREAQYLGKSIFDYAPKSNPAQDYRTIYEKLMKGE